MINKFLKACLFFFVVILVGNVLFLDYMWLKPKPTTLEQEVANALQKVSSEPKVVNTVVPEQTQTCGEVCQSAIKNEVKKAIADLPEEEEAVILTPTPTKAASSLSVYYLPIGGSTQGTEVNWTDIQGTDFYFNQADYPNLKSVRWEVNLRSSMPGNNVYVRLYDLSNNRVVDNSELFTNSGTSVLLRSNDLVIWRGNNLYRLQAKSSTGTPAYLDAPRLKITLE